MSELKPLLSSDATDFERQLLGAAAGERPSPELQLRMERAIGLGPAVVPAPDAGVGQELSGTRAAVKATSPRVGGARLQAALGAAVGIGLVAGGVALFSRDAPPAPTAAPVTPVSNSAAPPVEPVPAAVPVPNPSEDMSRESRELREEVDLLDRVRGAVSQGDAPTAAALLDRYFARFPQGALVREAAVLRTRATELARTPPTRP
jgi:hypothetical protein